MIQQGVNSLILKLKTKYTKDFSDLLKRAAIADNSSVNLEDFCNIVGEVVSIPKMISNDRWHKGFSTKDIQIGDTAIFSYNIVYDWYQKEHNGEPIYKNLISIYGNEFWKADITKVYAVIRNGEIIMLNGYIMAEPFEKDMIFTIASSKNVKGVKSSKIMHIGNPKEGAEKIKAKGGDTIYYSPTVPISYQINNKPFIILSQHHVLGVKKKQSE